MKKVIIFILSITVGLCGCTTHKNPEESSSSINELHPTPAKEDQKLRREQIRENLRKHQLDLIRQGIPPLSMPLDENLMTSALAEGNIRSKCLPIIFKTEITPELSCIINSSCFREMRQAIEKITKQRVEPTVKTFAEELDRNPLCL
jgi:hypothetical protein